MQAYRTILLVLHVLSAVIGIGATFTFGVLGSLQGRMPEASGPLLEANHAIERRLVNPFGLGLVPLTGALMIFSRAWTTDFFSHEWLVIAIVLYVITAGVATSVLSPGVRKLLELNEQGQGGTPEFMKLVAVQQRLGPLLTVLTVGIVVLMVWKPGG